jgi:hypothetical protein
LRFKVLGVLGDIYLVSVKTFLHSFAKSRPAGWIGECWLKLVGRGRCQQSGVDQTALRPAPIVTAIAMKYLFGMKNRNLNVRAELARVSVGRMFLHVACAMRDRRVQWHWEGIKREFGEPCRIRRRPSDV